MPARFKLLVGQHEQADPDWVPPKGVTRRKDGRLVDKDGKIVIDEETGKALRAPTRKYKQGDVVISNIDLMKRFGDQKFQYLGGTAEDARPQNPSVFPNGQVSTGIPVDQRVNVEPKAPDDEEFTSTFQGDPAQGQVEELDDVRKRVKAQASERAAADEAYGDLSEKTVAELKEIAEAEDVDLRGAHKKEDIIKAIRSGKKAEAADADEDEEGEDE